MANGDYRVVGEFFHLIMAGEWEEVISNCRKHRGNIGLGLTKTQDNVIHLAVNRGEMGRLSELVGIASLDDLERENTEGDRPLHLAAMRGDQGMCELLCRGRSTAITARNNRGEAPMYIASGVGAMGAFSFLLGEFMKLFSEPVPLVSWDQMSGIQSERFNEACIRDDNDTILHAAIRGEFIDLAYKIFKQFRQLAIIKNKAGETPIHLLAKLPSLFKSGYRPGIIKYLVYRFIPENFALKERSEWLTQEAETMIQIDVPALNETSESSQTEDEARIQNDVPGLHEISESSQTENQARIQNDMPGLHEISESSQTENQARIQNGMPGLQEISESSQTENQATNRIIFLLTWFKDQDTSMGIIYWFRRVQWGIRIIFLLTWFKDQIISMEIISRFRRVQWGNRIIFLLTWFKDQATSMEIISWFRRVQWDNRIIFLLTWFKDQATSMEIIFSFRRVQWVVGFFLPKSVLKEKRKHVLSYTMVEGIIEYMKQQLGENQSNNLMRSENATTNLSEANRNTSEGASTSNQSEATDVNRYTSEEPVANNTLEETYTDAPIVSAVKMGITEMVGMIVQSFPFTVEEVDRNGKNLVFLAAESRQPHVLGLLLKLNIRQTMVTERLKDGKNVLHVAAELKKDHHHPWSITSGAPLQMHLEVKWFELVKALMPSHLHLCENKKGEKPHEVFMKTHEKLVGEGLEWLSSTSRSCTVISSLLTTAALATAATVPGGVNSNGIPNLKDEWRFKAFSISALVTLCFGVLSLVMFLVILSSRSDAKNFKGGLPRKLIYGLTTLYLSLSTLLLAFCTAQSFAIHGRVRYVAYALYAILSLSIVYLVKEQLPLFFDFIEITFAKLQNWSNN